MKKILNKICISLSFIIVLSSISSGCSKENNNINTQQNAATYVENEDFQNFLGDYYNIAKVENGYYFFAGMNLYYLDTQTNEAYPVCDKPNCKHRDDCTSYFSMISYYPFGLSYYNNALYVLGWEQEGSNLRHNYVYEISLNNYKRKKIAYLFDSVGLDGINFIIHRGYIYYSRGSSGNLEETTDYLYRVKLGNVNKKSEPEIIYEFSGIGAALNSLKASANNIFVSSDCYGDIQGNDYKTANILIDIHSLKSRELVGNEAYNLFPDEEYVYYEKGENLVNRINLNTNEEEFFCEIEGPAYISADDNYVYFDNKQKMYIDESFDNRKILVYDKTGQYITEITPKSPNDNCYFGGNDIMIFKEVTVGESITNGINSNAVKGYYLLDKSQLTSADKRFTDVG